MKIRRAGEGAKKRGPADWFTGTVWLEDIVTGAESPHMRALRVTFEPSARTAWHTHPHGQALHLVEGVGRVQREGGEVVEVYPGDSVWFDPGERHWHGAAPNSAMIHVAVQQPDAEGNSAHWFEHVSDAQYHSR